MRIKFPKLVIEEARNLRSFATKEELAKLSFERLKPDNRSECIYGQLTGFCESDRAKELIDKCCSRVYTIPLDYGESRFAASRLNGSPIGLVRKYYFSPIERFIIREIKGANKRLIKYLKGEIKNL